LTENDALESEGRGAGRDTMNQMNHSLEEILFELAVQEPTPDERAAFLEGACRGYPALRAQLDALLEAHFGAAGFLPGSPASGPLPVAARSVPAEEGQARMIGRYKLLERIGVGGMGEVWMAEQREPVKRRVALKIIKPGMDSRQVVARFEAERQALAMMDHPNIARIFDAGTTDNGRPYFVMELVQGVRITEYCDENQLPTLERLKLFIHVCQAIQHAHQKGVIHRDIKPSNILVTLHDGVPVAKVIDFGIAKATETELTDKTLFTRFQQFVGTPAYISPEQAQMSGLDIDTRADIYSLGVLLYELLVGQTPFDARELAKGGLDALRQIIQEKEPLRPSTRWNTLPGAARTTAAQRRSTDAGHLAQQLQGDLDWIVMKCLEKDRSRRYETASGLAMDIQRHLADEPVLAGPPSRLYRLRKMVRRNRLAVAVAAAIVLTLVLGAAASTWQAVRATRAEKTAKTEASKSAQVAQFLRRMLKGVGPSAAKGRDTRMLREILDQTAAGIGKDLKDQPEVEAEMRGTMGGVYLALAAYDKAEAMHTAALALRRKSNPESRQVAESLNDLANVFYRQGKLAKAQATHEEALALRKRLLGNRSVEVASSLGNLANVLRDQGKLREAETMQREALALRKELLGTNSNDTAISLGNLAGVLSLEGKLKEGEGMQREALEVTKRALGNEDPDVAICLNDLADMLLAEGKLPDAEATNRVALALRIKLFGSEHPDVAFSLFNLANVLAAEGRLPEAEATHRQALGMRKKLLDAEHPDVAGSLNNLAGVLIRENKFQEAEAAQREALAIQRKLLPAEHQDIAGSLVNLAGIFFCQGRLVEAEATFREALAMQRKLLGNAHADVAMTLQNLAGVLQSEGKLAEAETLSREAMAMRRKLLGSEHPDLAASLNSLASVLQDLGKLPEAEALFREALAMRAKLLGSEDPAVAESLGGLAVVLERQRKLAEAEAAGRNELVLREKTLPGDWLTFDARCRLGAILVDRKDFAEAERLLLSGYAGMKEHEATIPVPDKSRLAEAIQSIVRLYEAANRPDQATEWKKKVEASRQHSW
jgi:serine/threonine protein kinase/tetratricopeptide (TPR) repeat protein